ncbi:SDR family oxidoreductase [Microbacterium tumbae]
MAEDEGAGGGRTLWVIGASSGMGRSAALSAARSGYRVAVSGRRSDELRRLAEEIEESGGSCLPLPLDVASTEEVGSAHAEIAAAWGPTTDLVYAAGLNTPRRYWRDQSIAEFAAVTETNLVAVARAVDAVLPDMRAVGRGTIVVISSFSGWQFSPDAGVAYSASKTAVSSLCRTLNAQEGQNGIRASNICPGDVDTDFLQMRPSVPDAAAREYMLTPDDVGAAVQFILDAPPHVRVDELVVSPTGILR